MASCLSLLRLCFQSLHRSQCERGRVFLQAAADGTVAGDQKTPASQREVLEDSRQWSARPGSE